MVGQCMSVTVNLEFASRRSIPISAHSFGTNSFVSGTTLGLTAGNDLLDNAGLGDCPYCVGGSNIPRPCGDDGAVLVDIIDVESEEDSLIRLDDGNAYV